MNLSHCQSLTMLTLTFFSPETATTTYLESLTRYLIQILETLRFRSAEASPVDAVLLRSLINGGSDDLEENLPLPEACAHWLEDTLLELANGGLCKTVRVELPDLPALRKVREDKDASQEYQASMPRLACNTKK